ncbi:PREDICTED: uncharacterized protein LOC109226054 [Nicotiana attenuata]|uniref:uncharacterized protein LOC109226054 n=1 Tax=Nicotiana attenuata TaxID=49451 RepID=UPI000904D8C8|nr:PREDICTED: uncharacterized protein LOC109226054 [Nicotiana attenuata]
MGRHTVQKSAGVLELDVVSALSAQIATLANQVNQMNLNINKQQIQLGTQNQDRPQAPQQQYRPPQVEQQASPTSHLEDMLKKVIAEQQALSQKVMAEQQALSQKVMAEQQALATIVRNLERQIGQLASAQNTRPAGALPSDTEANPRAAFNAVSLRNGRQLEEVQSKKRKQVTFNERPAIAESTSEPAKEPEKPAGEAVVEQSPQLVARPPPPFPQRLQKLRDNATYKKFLDILKQVQINIPLVDILQEVPKYAKYIKDIVANKRRLTEFETVALTEECSSRIKGKLPQKLKDPGSFTIQITIGKHAVGRALCDLGVSINLMPLSIFRQLGLGEPRPTTVILQLADRSLAHPEGVIEDVLVQVGSFIFPADFIILDYEPDQEVPFILGRPFLATGRAIIDVCEGKMTMRVGDRVEVFNVYRALKLPAHYEELSMISVVEGDATSLVPYEPCRSC